MDDLAPRQGRRKLERMQIELDADGDLLTEYELDYSKAKPNRFAEKYRSYALWVGLDPDVVEYFQTSDSVNVALRKYIEITHTTGSGGS